MNIDENKELVNKNIPSNSQSNLSEYINKLTAENNSLKIDLRNMEKKYLECKELHEKKNSIVEENKSVGLILGDFKGKTKQFMDATKYSKKFD